MSEKVLTRNRAKCLACGDVIESTYRHDFRSCTCGNLYVDGGLDYVKRGFLDLSKVEDMCEYETK